MRLNKAFLHIALLGFACVLLVGSGICTFIYYSALARMSNMYFYDLRLRYNEIECAHDGIDSFEIFERKISSEKFWGLPRPDKPEEKLNERIAGANVRFVHAYPAWHMAVFWWYGFIPYYVCVIIMAIVFTCSLAWACKWISERLRESDTPCYCTDILFLLATCLYPLSCNATMNYGPLLLGCTLLLFSLFEHGHDILAGIIYSLIMIKPQVGVLFLVPLFINRKYKTIVIAGAICIIETLFSAWKLDKSPVELILQIPQIGAPFPKGIFAEMMTKICGPFGQYISMGVFIGFAVSGCFLVRNAKEMWVRFLPAIAFIPFWTYSMPNDWLVVLPCYLYIVIQKKKHPRIYECCLYFLVFWVIVIFSRNAGWYSIGKKGLSVILHLLIVLSGCFMAISDTNNICDLNILKLKCKSFFQNKGASSKKRTTDT